MYIIFRNKKSIVSFEQIKNKTLLNALLFNLLVRTLAVLRNLMKSERVKV